MQMRPGARPGFSKGVNDRTMNHSMKPRSHPSKVFAEMQVFFLADQFQGQRGPGPSHANNGNMPRHQVIAQTAPSSV